MPKDERLTVHISTDITPALDARILAWQSGLPAETSKGAVVRALIEAGLDAVAARQSRRGTGVRP